VIPIDVVTSWNVDHPWANPDLVEQDLLLTRAICAIATDPYLGAELVFRGGTAFHKLHLEHAYRYSEDLDYVRSSAGGIGELTRALTDLGESLDFDVRTRISMHPKVYWRTTSAQGGPLRIKIEVNTHERSPAFPLMHMPYRVESAWWTGEAEVLTFQTAELIATKIRALYQRSKGRDLFDLWLALTELGVPAGDILAAFEPYRSKGLTAAKSVANLQAKLQDRVFRTDLDPLLARTPDGYDIDSAASFIIDSLLAQIG